MQGWALSGPPMKAARKGGLCRGARARDKHSHARSFAQVPPPATEQIRPAAENKLASSYRGPLPFSDVRPWATDKIGARGPSIPFSPPRPSFRASVMGLTQPSRFPLYSP